jgi:hypothetical protein
VVYCVLVRDVAPLPHDFQLPHRYGPDHIRPVEPKLPIARPGIPLFRPFAQVVRYSEGVQRVPHLHCDLFAGGAPLGAKSDLLVNYLPPFLSVPLSHSPGIISPAGTFVKEVGRVLRLGCLEAVLCLLGYAFGDLGLHRVVAITDQENEPSFTLLERLGMRREGCFVQNAWFKGRWTSEYLYAVLEDEWSRKPRAGSGVHTDP